MRAKIALIILLFTPLAVAWEEPPKSVQPAAKAERAAMGDPKAFMQEVIKALGNAKTVSYDVDYVVTGWFGFFLPNIKGSVILGKDTELKSQRFRSTLTLEPAGSSEKSTVISGADGSVYYVVDDSTKTVHADMDPAVVGKSRWGIEFAMVKEFAMPDPFAEIVKDGEIKFEGATKVGEVECVSLRLKSPNQPEALWEFAVSDHLPRRITFSQVNEKGDEGRAVMTLNKLTVNPTFVKDPFELVVPEGYTKTDAFAP